MTTKDRILDAAEQIVLRDGAARLTLDAVAAEASLSKGGVLYNFSSKDDLIRGMITRLLDRFEEDMGRVSACDPKAKSRTVRAFLDVWYPEPAPVLDHPDQVCAALLAAVATNPLLLAPVRDRFRDLQAKIEADAADPVAATIIRLAASGLWMFDLFGLAPVAPEMRSRVLARLRELTQTE
jgi:AcrR family transcriptional regulator